MEPAIAFVIAWSADWGLARSEHYLVLLAAQPAAGLVGLVLDLILGLVLLAEEPALGLPRLIPHILVGVACGGCREPAAAQAGLKSVLTQADS